jgi:hypothetical protein
MVELYPIARSGLGLELGRLGLGLELERERERERDSLLMFYWLIW